MKAEEESVRQRLLVLAPAEAPGNVSEDRGRHDISQTQISTSRLFVDTGGLNLRNA